MSEVPLYKGKYMAAVPFVRLMLLFGCLNSMVSGNFGIVF